MRSVYNVTFNLSWYYISTQLILISLFLRCLHSTSLVIISFSGFTFCLLILEYSMKKLSKVQQKQQDLVMNTADMLEEQARAEIPGMVQCWFDVEYHLFPGSLLLCFQFENEQALASAEPDLLKWQKRLSAAMMKKGVILKNMRKHLVFTMKGPED